MIRKECRWEKSRSCVTSAAALIANALAACAASASPRRSEARNRAAFAAISRSSATGCDHSKYRGVTLRQREPVARSSQSFRYRP
jgi:hypothetical protein